MSQKINTPNPITAAQLTIIDTSIAAIETIVDDANVPLTESQIKSLIAVSTIRADEITDVDNIIITPFPQTVPVTISTVDFHANLAYVVNLKKRQALLVTLAGKLQTLIEIGENDAIVEVNTIMNSARLLGAGNKDIQEGVNKITAKYFVRTPVNKGTSYLIAPSGIITIHKVVTGKKFVNTKATILSLLQVGASIATAIKVNPYFSVEIPKSWTNIIVTNLSATDEGSFEVFVN